MAVIEVIPFGCLFLLGGCLVHLQECLRVRPSSLRRIRSAEGLVKGIVAVTNVIHMAYTSEPLSWEAMMLMLTLCSMYFISAVVDLASSLKLVSLMAGNVGDIWMISTNCIINVLRFPHSRIEARMYNLEAGIAFITAVCAILSLKTPIRSSRTPHRITRTHSIGFLYVLTGSWSVHNSLALSSSFGHDIMWVTIVFMWHTLGGLLVAILCSVVSLIRHQPKLPVHRATHNELHMEASESYRRPISSRRRISRQRPVCGVTASLMSPTTRAQNQRNHVYTKINYE